MKILFNTQFGSAIYGTSTPASDLDYKGIFMAEPRDIIMGNNVHSVVKSTGKDYSRNTENDVDTELKELRRFIADALVGQTYSVDMLYAPMNLWQTTSPEWEFIVTNRSKFLSKNASSFIGYCNTQASKYGLKGTRLGAVLDVLEKLKKMDPNSKLGENERFPESVYVKYVIHQHKASTGLKDQEMLEVLGKFYSNTILVKNVLESLSIFEQRYGERAKLAMDNSGVDWKSLSHAYRCCYQLMDMAKNGTVTFPLKEAPYLIKIKTGQIGYKEIIQDELPLLMEEAISAIKSSGLPEEPDFDFWNNWIYETYLNYLKQQ